MTFLPVIRGDMDTGSSAGQKPGGRDLWVWKDKWLVMELIPCLCFRFCFKGTQVEIEVKVVWGGSIVQMGASDAEQGLTAQCM